MIEVVNRTQGRAANDHGEFHQPLADDPQMQPMLRRLGENICPFSAIDRVQHAKNIAAAVVTARARAAR